MNASGVNKRPRAERRHASAPTRQSKRACVAIVAVIAGWTSAVTIAGQVLFARVDTFGIRPGQVADLLLTTRIHGAIAATSLGLLLLIHRKLRLSSRWPKLALVCFWLAALISADRLLAVVHAPMGGVKALIHHHPRRGFGHRPNAIGYESGCTTRTNRFGFRGPPLPDEKHPDEFRILFLGDSVTFGFQLTDEHTPTNLAAQQLRDPLSGRSVRALNAAVSGYTTWQELDILKHEGIAAEPDIVVFQFCINDVLDVIGVNNRILLEKEAAYAFEPVEHWSGFVRAMRGIAASKLDRESVNQFLWTRNGVFGQGHPAGVETLLDVYRDPPLPAIAKGWDVCLGDLDKVLRFCRERNLPFVLTYLPERSAFADDGRHQAPVRILQAWADRHDVSFVNLTAPFRKSLDEGTTLDALYIDTVHPTRAGAELMARAVSRAILRHPKITPMLFGS